MLWVVIALSRAAAIVGDKGKLDILNIEGIAYWRCDSVLLLPTEVGCFAQCDSLRKRPVHTWGFMATLVLDVPVYKLRRFRLRNHG